MASALLANFRNCLIQELAQTPLNHRGKPGGGKNQIPEGRGELTDPLVAPPFPLKRQQLAHNIAA